MNDASALGKGAATGVSRAGPPALPVNWYMLAGSSEVSHGRLITRSLYGREYVLYRSPATGLVTAFSALCAHMGCHLRHAQPEANGVRCALHHRLIGTDGVFVAPDGRTSAGLVQPRLVVREHLGGIFVWIGPDGPTPSLPDPAITADGPVAARYVGAFEFDNAWYSLIANGFDMEHLSSVHRRELREEPVIDTSAPERFRISYRTRITGTTLSDRVMKWLSGDQVRASMTAVHGSLMLVESQVFRPSFVLLSMVPRGDGGTTARALIGGNGVARKPLDALRLRVTSWLFRRFFEADFEILDGLQWHPPDPVLNRTDGFSRSLFEYFCTQKDAVNA